MCVSSVDVCECVRTLEKNCRKIFKNRLLIQVVFVRFAGKIHNKSKASNEYGKKYILASEECYSEVRGGEFVYREIESVGECEEAKEIRC